MENQLIIHGHFYQPPREDPWTGLIPYQDSASPYHDWNHRITNECYAANTKSRVLDGLGLVTDILNNFCHISFNFGPTLLNWLKKERSDIYKAIIKADTISQEKNNHHGNAIAQGYNHTILPLCTEQDARTQIIWGLEDFAYHFGRRAEGLWLSEAAANNNVVDLLIEQQVKFIILSPWQADSICPVGSNHWQPLNNNPAPPGRAYRLERPGGSIAVFFYNHVLAHGISFEHYLTNADRLYERFLSFRQATEKSYLLNVATDGEVYGHHEPFGDMCLAALSKLVEKKQDFVFTNYGYYLEQFPPVYLVKLKAGEANLGTSWSCVHGVSRWYKNCGCKTGGQNNWGQEWRTPVRNALNVLNENLLQIYREKMRQFCSGDPMDIRNDYIHVLTEAESREDFAAKYIDRLQADNGAYRNEFFSLLEGQKFCQYMFTSCGWFFSEISGLEAMQNLKYAVKAIDLYSRYDIHEIVENFLETLENARSNISTYGSGRNLVETWVYPERKDLEYGAAIFALKELCGYKDNDPYYGIYKKDQMVIDEKTGEDDVCNVMGKITVIEYTTFKKADFDFSFTKQEMQGISLKLENRTDRSKSNHNTVISDLPLEIRKQITDLISIRVVDKCIADIAGAFDITKDALSKIKNLNIHAAETILKLAELLIDRIFEELFNDPAIAPRDEELVYIKELICFSRNNKLKVDIESLKEKISSLIYYQVGQLTDNVLEEPSRGIIHLLDVCRSVDIEPEITHAQDIVFSLLQESKRQSMQTIEELKDFKGLNRMRRLIKLGSQLGINVDPYKEKFFDI